MAMLRHLLRDGNGFGVVMVRVEVWNGLNFLPTAHHTHTPTPTHTLRNNSPSSPTNLIGEKCFRHYGLRPHLTPMGNYSQTM